MLGHWLPIMTPAFVSALYIHLSGAFQETYDNFLILLSGGKGMRTKSPWHFGSLEVRDFTAKAQKIQRMQTRVHLLKLFASPVFSLQTHLFAKVPSSTVHERAKSFASSQWLSLEYVCDVLCFLSARLLMPVKKRKNSDPIMYSTYTSFQSWLRAGIVTFFLL